MGFDATTTPATGDATRALDYIRLRDSLKSLSAAGSHDFGGDPNDCKTADCWVEVSWEGQPPGAARQRLWINGVLRIDASKTGINYSGGVQSVYLWGYFNTPADARTETMDDLTFSTGYIGGIS